MSLKKYSLYYENKQQIRRKWSEEVFVENNIIRRMSFY